MNTEEPAWRRELSDALERIAWDIERGNGLQGGIDYARNELGSTVFEAIQAAEERGREAALREAADHLESIDPIEFALGSVDAVREVLRMAAEAESP